MKVWITKYALTKGILEAEAIEELSDRPAGVNTIEAYGGNGRELFYGEGKEWHESKESAIAKAEEMRVKAIANHRKSIAKLEKTRFE
jgi:hypothetical protein